MTEKKTTRSPPTNADDRGINLPARLNTGPATIFQDLFKPFDEFFQPFFPLTQSKMSGLGGFRQPILDIQDRGDHFSVTAELPGFTKDEVQVKVDSEGLELRADKSQEDKNEKGAYQRSTRSYYQYLTLPEEVVTSKIDGTMKNGILQLKLPKRASKLGDSTRRVDLK